MCYGMLRHTFCALTCRYFLFISRHFLSIMLYISLVYCIGCYDIMFHLYYYLYLFRVSSASTGLVLTSHVMFPMLVSPTLSCTQADMHTTFPIWVFSLLYPLIVRQLLALLEASSHVLKTRFPPTGR